MGKKPSPHVIDFGPPRISELNRLLEGPVNEIGALEATVELDTLDYPHAPPREKLQKGPCNIISPDDAPPEHFDPEFHPSQRGRGPIALRKAADARVKLRQANKLYHNALIETMGKDMETLQAALSTSDSENVRKFCIALNSMKYRGWTVTRIASSFGISPAQLTNIWKDYHLAKAMLNITSALPRTTARMVEDAQGGEVVCPHCDGRTTVRIEMQYTTEELRRAEAENRELSDYKVAVCPNCHGEGTIVKPGHEHSRDRILEMAGLTKKGGLNVTTVINMPQVESVIDELERSKAVPVTYTEHEG